MRGCGVGQRARRATSGNLSDALSRLALLPLLSRYSLTLTHFTNNHPHTTTTMQAAADAVKSAVQNTGASSSGSSTVQDKFSQGWKPDANAEKAAQGGDDSRPPGTQHTMKGASPFPFLPTRLTLARSRQTSPSTTSLLTAPRTSLLPSSRARRSSSPAETLESAARLPSLLLSKAPTCQLPQSRLFYPCADDLDTQCHRLLASGAEGRRRHEGVHRKAHEQPVQGPPPPARPQVRGQLHQGCRRDCRQLWSPRRLVQQVGRSRR